MNLNDQFAQQGSLMLQPSTIEGAGIGLFATAEFPKGIPVCEYKGDILSAEEMSQRYAYTVPHHGFPKPKGLYCIDNHFPVEGKGERQFIDAHPAVSLNPIGYGSFINDKYAYPNRTEAPGMAPKSPETNYEQYMEDLASIGYNVYFYPVPKATLYLIMSCKKILPGDEIVVNYGNSYWNPDDWESVKKFEERSKANPEPREVPAPVKKDYPINFLR